MVLLQTHRWPAVLLGIAASVVGCGRDSANTNDPAGIAATESDTVLPAAAINAPPHLADEEIRVTPPQPGTPESVLLQIIRLSQQPIPESDDLDVLRAARRERNTEIIALATDVIAQTHSNPAKEQVFNTAVHRLMESTYQLALQGDRDRVDELYGHAEALHDRDPASRAAVEANWVVARFANEQAERFDKNRLSWLQSFSRQALVFADRFPHEQERAVRLLDEAAASCDAHALIDEATQCYAMLREKFPNAPQAEQAIGPLRRLNLPGKRLDLGGPTLDGGFIDPSMFANRPALIVFWSTQAKPFLDSASLIIRTAAKYESQSLQVVGVNMDTDETAVDAFLVKSGADWKNIFHTDPARRGWNSPVASYYGVRTIPQLWLIDARGTVVSTTVQPRDLDAALARLIPLRAAR
jgi:hypothetical protein